MNKHIYALSKKHPFIMGTAILTLTGLLSRFIGFFYRIYLSRLFGEEGMGIYQLISPVLALSFALTASGMQTAISKFVAAEFSRKNESLALHYLVTGICITLSLSFLCMWFTISFSEMIAGRFLLEPRTASLLRIVAISIPLGAVHSCINGYYYGLKKTGMPALTQLLEQFCRIGCVFAADKIALHRGLSPTINSAVIGLVVGEALAMIVSLLAIYKHFFLSKTPKKHPLPCYTNIGKKLLQLAIPLSLTRIIVNLLQSVEAVLLPSKMQIYGYDTVTALSVYGVLTGMALPLLFFPNALTGAMSLMLLPMVSEADASGNHPAIRRTTTRTIYSCLIVGILCALFFLLSGNFLGTFLFKSELAGRFLSSLSFLCPFLYLGTTLSGILHGLGKSVSVFFINISALSLRLIVVIFLVPVYGINVYLLSMN